MGEEANSAVYMIVYSMKLLTRLPITLRLIDSSTEPLGSPLSHRHTAQYITDF
jgi:hypothetical protein